MLGFPALEIAKDTDLIELSAWPEIVCLMAVSLRIRTAGYRIEVRPVHGEYR
jgi:hypothetical protein